MAAAGSDSPRLLLIAARRRWVLRAGFAALLAVLAVSAFLAYDIQRRLSNDTATIYRDHIQQDEALQRLRRTVWQSSVVVRDFLLNPAPDREAAFRKLNQGFEQESESAVSDLALHPIPGHDSNRLKIKLADFWITVAAVPDVTTGLDRESTYRYVQNEIAPRRVALSELLREVTALSRSSLAEGDQRLNQSWQSASRRLGLLIGVALVAGIVSAFLSLRQLGKLESRMLAQYQEVERTKSELQALSGQLMALQEAERARLSRELHDEIGQALATIRLELARIESSGEGAHPDRRRLERARALVDSTVKTVRNISLMLRPSLLDDLGLVAALQWLSEDFSRRTGIPCRVTDASVSESLAEDHLTCAYRVVQEALHNVEKHASASRVEIRIEQSGDTLAILVEDDGRGIDPAGLIAGPQLGILGMRERLAALGGGFSISPGTRRGTRIEAWLPVAAKAPAPETVEA